MSRLLPRAVGLAAALVLAAGLAAVAVQPTGAPTAVAAAPSRTTVVLVHPVGKVRVLLLVDVYDRLELEVVYPTAKGWLGLSLRSAPVGTTAGWTDTAGGGAVPALSAVYGRGAPDATVTVSWADGVVQRVVAGLDGSWLAVRPAQVPFERVLVRGGGETTTLSGPPR